MRIPENDYTFDTFVRYLLDNERKVFGGGERKRWLKVYLVHAMRRWEPLFHDLPQRKLGEFLRISMQAKGLARTVEFYVHEWSPGILVFFTSSRREEYEKTLKRFIRSNRGITEMRIRRSLFVTARNYLLDKHEAVVYSFISRRGPFSKARARLRPAFDRRLSYTGDDGKEVLKEVLDFYGVLPDSVNFRVGTDKLQITSGGLLLFRSVNERTVQIMTDLLKMLTEPQRIVREVSDSLERTTRTVRIGEVDIQIPVVVPGVITLQGPELDRNVIERFFRQEDSDSVKYSLGPEPTEIAEFAEEPEAREFSFIDTSIREGSFSFSATVVDDIKGTMFGVSGTSERMILVPMHRTIFESFVRFYELVVENLDEEARFDVLPPETQVK